MGRGGQGGWGEGGGKGEGEDESEGDGKDERVGEGEREGVGVCMCKVESCEGLGEGRLACGCAPPLDDLLMVHPSQLAKLFDH